MPCTFRPARAFFREDVMITVEAERLYTDTLVYVPEASKIRLKSVVA